jgi:germination protein M
VSSRTALLAAALAALCAGCGGSGTRTVTVTSVTTVTPAPPPTTTQASTSTVTPYFLDGEQIAAGQPVATPERGIAAAALRVVLDGPNGQEIAGGLTSAIPPRVRLNGLTIERGTATVDLSRDFEDGGGSLSMQARVAQVVYTLTQFPTVKRVAFRLEGRPVRAIGGEGVVVDPPVDRLDFEAVTPAILVESPGFATAVSSPFTARGTANTFEANLQWELRDGAGKLLAKDFATATSGSGTRGTFSFPITFSVSAPTQGALVVFEGSAADGSRIHVRSIPLTLVP